MCKETLLPIYGTPYMRYLYSRVGLSGWMDGRLACSRDCFNTIVPAGISLVAVYKNKCRICTRKHVVALPPLHALLLLRGRIGRCLFAIAPLVRTTIRRGQGAVLIPSFAVTTDTVRYTLKYVATCLSSQLATRCLAACIAPVILNPSTTNRR